MLLSLSFSILILFIYICLYENKILRSCSSSSSPLVSFFALFCAIHSTPSTSHLFFIYNILCIYQGKTNDDEKRPILVFFSRSYSNSFSLGLFLCVCLFIVGFFFFFIIRFFFCFAKLDKASIFFVKTKH